MIVCVYLDVFGPEANAAIFELAVAQRGNFESSRTSREQRVDPSARVSTVVYDHRLTSVSSMVQEAVASRMHDAVSRLGMDPFAPSGFELQMTSHNDGEFFKRHKDAGSDATATRALTYVYYFHREPKGYSGGEIVFFGADGSEQIVDPANDMMVMFDPRTAHEVRPISCESGEFEDGRFTLNGWLRRERARRPSSFFDARIFKAVGSWPGVRWDGSAGLRTESVSARHQPGHAENAAEIAHLRGLMNMYGDLHRLDPAHRDVACVSDLTSERFFADYYQRNRPVLWKGVLRDSRALETWSPKYFAETYGDVPVDITSGRESRGDYETRYQELIETVTMNDFVQRLEYADPSNDFYLIARNYLFENPALAGLRDDLVPPAGIIDNQDRRRGTTKAWIGPAGTVTPLHFDKHSILFTQVYGSKEFTLLPAFETPRMYVRDSFYSAVDPEEVDHDMFPRFPSASMMRVTVEPGDGLYLPAGWWHWAKSLSTSISVTFSSFMVDGRNTPLVI